MGTYSKLNEINKLEENINKKNQKMKLMERYQI